MTTRPVSTQNDYPFIPEVPSVLKPVAFGILDIFFVIQGDPDGSLSSSSSSAADIHNLDLIQWSATGAVTEFVFRAREDDKYWDIVFEVPNSSAPGQIGMIPNVGGDCYAVLFYNSDDIVAGSSSVIMAVEPGRAEWHTEFVTALQFYNIQRCETAEDDTIWVELLFPSSSAENVIRVEDGYNCEVSFENGVLQFLAGRNLGKGISPDFGNTGSSCGSSSGDETEGITLINGISPVNGDIPLAVSNGLGKQRSTGKIELVKKT